MNKVVYNDCYGGFGLSREAADWLKVHYPDYFSGPCVRHDPRLIECIETLGKKASGQYAKLRIAEIQGNTYRIDDYDGAEHIVEPDDLDWIVIDKANE